MPTTPLTAPRRKALEVLGRSTEPVPVAGGTITADEDGGPTIGNRVAKWLEEADYARRIVLVDSTTWALDITEAGLAAFHRLDHDEVDEEASAAQVAADKAAQMEETFGPGDDGTEEETADQTADAFAGIDTAAIRTSIGGVLARITRPLHHREVITVVAQVEVTGLNFPATKNGIARHQAGAVLDAFEVRGKPGRTLVNALKQAHDPSPLPFRAKADASIIDATIAGITDAAGVVVTPGDRAALGLAPGTVAVIFANGARAAWPDDFPKGTDRPSSGEFIEVPGAGDGYSEQVTEVLDMVTGQPITDDTITAVGPDEGLDA